LNYLLGEQMLPLILAPILTKLAENGLNILSSAIQAKGIDLIEKKLGVSVADSMKTEEGIFKLKQLEITHEEFLLNTAIENRKLDLESDKLEIDNTKDAREMNARIQESTSASEIAKKSPYYLDFFIVGSTIVLFGFILFVEIPANNKELIYMALGSFLTMCGTILNFHRGTSTSSRGKDDTINKLAEKSK